MIQKTKKSLYQIGFVCLFAQLAMAQSATYPGKNILMDYVFKDSTGTAVKLSDYRGKYLMLDIWYSGCGGCISVNEGLSVVHEKLKDSNLVFFSISVDKEREKWMASITPNAKPTKLNPWAAKYVPYAGTVALYTGGTRYENEFIRKFVPNNVYPKLMFIDKEGNLIDQKPPRPDFEPERLIEFIKEKMSR